MAVFVDVSFPTEISKGSSMGPEFNTTIVSTRSGREANNENWENARIRANAQTGVRSAALMSELVDFFRAMRGRSRSFRFRDWTDYELIDEPIGVGNGAQTVFQLIRTYGSVDPEVRNITKPVTGTILVSINGSPLGSGWTLNYSTGVLTFSSPPSPGAIITVDGEFDVEMRFDIDYLEVDLEAFDVRQAPSIPLVEILRE